MAVSKVGPTGLSSAVGALGKNVIINGAHTIDQRAAETRTGLGAANFRLDDQWRLTVAGSSSSRWTASVETAAGPRDNSKWLKLLCTTGDASPGAAEAAYIRHVIEGQQGQSLMNTATTGVRDMTVSMYFIASLASGSFPAKVCISFATFDGTGRQFLSDQSITAASTWQKISFTIPADATAELANDNGAGAAIVIGLVGGSNSVAAEGWSANATDFITSNTQNWGATADNFIGYTDVQLEPGPVATDFEHEPISATLAKCQRYYERWTIDDATSTRALSATSSTTAQADGLWWFKVAKRADPTFAASAAATFVIHYLSGTAAGTAVFGDALSQEKCRVGITGISGSPLTVGLGCYITRDGSDATYLEAISEL